jgi:hypothetical protein
MLGFVLWLAVSQSPYEASRARLELERREMAKHRRTVAVRSRARQALLRWVDDVAFPAWAGTPWAFEGMTTTPREGQVACGYYVSTVLLHAGVKLERIRLSQQSAAHIAQSLAAGTRLDVLGDRAADVVARARARGDGLYVVGLDNHVGFLRVDGARADFCHASYFGSVGVVCEPALGSAAFTSATFVLADVFSDAVVDLWLNGRKLQTIRR